MVRQISTESVAKMIYAAKEEKHIAAIVAALRLSGRGVTGRRMGSKKVGREMRDLEQIKQRMDALRTRFAVLYSTDSEASIRVYVSYRELYWVLHPEINDDTTLAKEVNKDIGL